MLLLGFGITVRKKAIFVVKYNQCHNMLPNHCSLLLPSRAVYPSLSTEDGQFISDAFRRYNSELIKRAEEPIGYENQVSCFFKGAFLTLI